MKPSRSAKRLTAAALLLALTAPLSPRAWGESAPTVRPFSYFGFEVREPERMAERYELIILHNHPHAPPLLAEAKIRFPGVRTLMYRELFCVLQNETPLEESVGHYEKLLAEHPDWFQRTPDGRLVEVPDYPGPWVMDLGHPGWQDLWIKETLRDVIESGWDGVFADDVLTSVKAHDLPPLATYRDDASLQRVVTEFLRRAAAAFHAEGKLFFINASSTYHYPGLFEQWIDIVDGIMEEHFAGDSWTWGAAVAGRQLEAMRAARKRGKWLLCMTYGPWSDEQRMRTSMAAYLLEAGPRILWSYRPYERGDDPAWHPSWEVDLGRPLEVAGASGGVWARAFERGAVAVNIGRQTRVVTVHGDAVTIPGRRGVVVEKP